MSDFKKLLTGTAYHSNRVLTHVANDMREIAEADMDICVHMYTHNDMERHRSVMKDIVKATYDVGLDVWMDNWGIGGAPGEKSHFLAYHPEAHTYYGNGIMHPYQICLNSPAYRDFVKRWTYEVAELGVKTVFWDEPNIPSMRIDGTDDYYSSCTCPTCRRLFKERFGHDMPEVMDEEVSLFREETIVEYHSFISEYAHSLGLVNTICFMPFQLNGVRSRELTRSERLLNFDLDKICAMPYIDNVGTDPYWFRSNESPYEYNYTATRRCLDVAGRHGKDHNIWIQGYGAPRGSEREIIEATEAVYDAGARTILSWSFHGGESNDYRSENTVKTWNATKEGFRRIRDMDNDRILAENRKKYMK